MAAGVNKLHLPLVAGPTHPHYHVAGGRAKPFSQCHKRKLHSHKMELYSVTDTGPPSNSPRQGPGAQCSIPRAPWSWAVQVTGCEPEPFLAYSLRPRVAAAVAWPLPMLGAWLCAPIPFLTELYKGLLKKKYKQSALKKGRTLETVQNMENTIPATGVEGEGRGQLGAYRTS